MRIATRRSNGKLLEMQSAATPGTLTANAVSAGIPDDDVAEQEVTAAEYAALWATLRPPPPPEPTRAELLDQVQALLARVEALPA